MKNYTIAVSKISGEEVYRTEVEAKSQDRAVATIEKKFKAKFKVKNMADYKINCVQDLDEVSSEMRDIEAENKEYIASHKKEEVVEETPSEGEVEITPPAAPVEKPVKTEEEQPKKHSTRDMHSISNFINRMGRKYTANDNFHI